MPVKKAAKKTSQKTAYFNRELSWLAFNRRVLELAQSDKLPWLERMKFLSIVSSNLDEFFEIRVAGLVQQVDSGVIERGMDGIGPKEQLRRIHSISGTLVSDQYRCWREEIVPGLKQDGVIFKTKEELTRTEKRWIKDYFDKQIYPVLTPMAIDPAHPFPQLINKGMYLLAWLDDPTTKEIETMMAVIPVPRLLPRVVAIETKNKEGTSYIFLSDVIKLFVASLFPGYKVRGSWAFRITRNSDLYIDEEEVENLLTKIEEELHKMRRGAAVRLEIEEDVNEEIMSQLLTAIQLPQEYVFRINGPINLNRLMTVYGIIDRPDLKYAPFFPHTPAALLQPEKLFSHLAKKDYLLHHPYDSFTPVVDFLQQAARDPKVFAIKQTLYRTSGDSPIIEALKAASRNGKQVTALVELKARFDELNNIQWARELENVGVHVVYGIVGLKTHCKCSLVVRREGKGLKHYAHLGTGNYNPKTARIYTDISYFTSNEEVTSEVAYLFNTLTGFSRAPEFKTLLVAPFNLHSSIQNLIKRETRNAKAGKKAKIIAKINSLVDKETIDNLYLASQAGVQIELIIRGICALVPNVKGLSENIRVRSILGRYLEHTRIYYFENGDQESDVFIGSADWMQRNFFKRIESVVPIKDPELKRRVISEILGIHLKDNEYSKILKSNGAYYPVHKSRTEQTFCAQDYLMAKAEERRKIEQKKLEEGDNIEPRSL